MKHEMRQWTAQYALEWAFRREKAQLELPDLRPVEERGFGFGVEHVLLEQIQLGTRVDKSHGKSLVHHDADVIAAIVGGHPVRHLAIRMAECARLGITPDWMPGAEPKIEPADWKRRGKDAKAATEFLRTEIYYRTYRHPKNHRRKVTVKKEYTVDWCPIITNPHPESIKTARRAYENWWKALNMVREHLQACKMLSTIEITNDMPPKRPWNRKEKTNAI